MSATVREIEAAIEQFTARPFHMDAYNLLVEEGWGWDEYGTEHTLPRHDMGTFTPPSSHQVWKVWGYWGYDTATQQMSLNVNVGSDTIPVIGTVTTYLTPRPAGTGISQDEVATRVARRALRMAVACMISAVRAVFGKRIERGKR